MKVFMRSGVGCLYMPHFGAWALSQGVQTVNIATTSENRIVSASGDLRAAGLTLGMTKTRARALFPEAEFHPRDELAEATYGTMVADMAYSKTPQVKILENKNGALWVLVQGISRSGFDALLAETEAYGGYATCPSLARIAALSAKVCELVVVPQEHEARFLSSVPINVLMALQFCGDHVEFLEWMGMGTLGSVSRLTKRQLKAQFAAEGTRLYGLLHPTVAERRTRIPYWHNQTRTGQIDLPDQIEREQLAHYLESLMVETLPSELSCIRLGIQVNRSAVLYGQRVLKMPTRNVRALVAEAWKITDSLLSRVAEIRHLQLDMLLRDIPPTQGDLWQKPQWETLHRRLSRRFPRRMFVPQVHAHSFLPETLYSLRNVGDDEP